MDERKMQDLVYSELRKVGKYKNIEKMDDMQNSKRQYRIKRKGVDFMSSDILINIFNSANRTILTIHNKNGDRLVPYIETIFENNNIEYKRSLWDSTYKMYEFGSSHQTEDTTKTKESQIIKPKNLSEILSPLDEVFFEEDILSSVLMKTGVVNLIKGETPKYPGVILYGPPGTGKTQLQKGVAEIYSNMGAYSKELNLSSDLSEPWVGSRGKALEDKIQVALAAAKKNKIPSFVYLDEAGTLMTSNKHDSTSKYYQEGLDVLKKYIGNFPELVFSITTNDKKADFDSAIVREGRMTPLEIGYPSTLQISRMWKYFTKKEIGKEFANKEFEILGEMTPNKQGAFIEEFCRTYVLNSQLADLNNEGIGIKDALIEDKFTTESEVLDELTFDRFAEDVEKRIKSSKTKKSKKIGFDLELSKEN